ncbi:Homeobox protein HD-1 [Orobanche gracilis]
MQRMNNIGQVISNVSMAVPGEDHHQLKEEIAAHSLYEQLLSAHVATPIDQLPLIDAQLSESHYLLRLYAQNNTHSLSQHQRQELDSFLASKYTIFQFFAIIPRDLFPVKLKLTWTIGDAYMEKHLEQLHQHVKVHAVEAVMACREIEQNLQSLTGTIVGEGTGAAMSDDEDELQMDYSLDHGASDHDLMGLGPLLPTESERSLMERVRQELKIELKQGFKSRIEDVREEILRKRRAGKLPGYTTTVLKNWWQQHSKWPYPTKY